MRIFIKTHAGLEETLKNEVVSLGGLNVGVANRSVFCEGEKDVLYTLNYNLRTALRILVPIYEFKAKNERDLYHEVIKFNWSEILSSHQTLAIDHTVFSDFFRHSRYVALKVKDAIVDQIRSATGSRPSVNVENPDIRFNVHCFKDKFTISLDSSGESLNKRGYRSEGHMAPINESLAAGMLRLANWKPGIPLLDPMCGSGTFLIEAAMVSHGIPPQYLRKDFGFKTWRDFDPGLWNNVKTASDANIRKSSVEIFGGDQDQNAVKLAQKSLRKLGLDRFVLLHRRKIQDWLPPVESGMIITNPPYGERIGSGIDQLYEEVGDTLKQRFSGYQAWVLSANRKAMRKLRLKPDQTFQLFNGSLQCDFCRYNLYEGSKK